MCVLGSSIVSALGRQNPAPGPSVRVQVGGKRPMEPHVLAGKAGWARDRGIPLARGVGWLGFQAVESVP
jgi:hypothetical protein